MMGNGKSGWIAGEGWGVIAPGILAWFGEADPNRLERLYEAATAGSPATELIPLAETAVRGTAPVAVIAVWRQGLWAITLRGPVVCEVGGGGAVERHTSGRGGQMRRVDVASPAWLRLGPSSAGFGAAALPVSAGVIACGGIAGGDGRPAPVPSDSATADGPVAEAPTRPHPGTRSPLLPPPEPSRDNPFAELWGHTIRRPVEAAAIREIRDTSDPRTDEGSHPTTLPEEAADDAARVPDGATLIGSVIDDEPASYGTATASTGGAAEIRRFLVIGRAPALPVGEVGDVLRVANPGRDVSRSHVALRVRHHLVSALDLGSNNGTRLLRPGAPPATLSTDDWMPVRSGDVLDLAEGVRITLEDLP